MKLKINLFGIVEFLFVLMMLILSSRKMIQQLFIMTGEFPLFSNNTFFTVTLLLFAILLSKHLKEKIKLEYLILAIIFLIIIFVSIFLSETTITLFTGVRNFVISYYYIFILLLALAFKLKLRNQNIIVNLIFFFCLFQSILGLLQYLTSQTFVPVEYDGKAIVNSIYYLNGSSSSNAYFLQLGAKVRAFGMTDSGLTLGLFALLGFVLSLIRKSRFNLVFLALFALTIYASLTRVVWIAFVLLIIMFALKKIVSTNTLRNVMFYFGMTAQVFLVIFSLIISKIEVSENLLTLASRFSGYTYYLNALPLNIGNFMFGQNFINKIPDLSTIYSLDNELLKLIFDVGVLGTIIVFMLYKRILNRVDKVPVVLFLTIYPFFGIVNVVGYFFFPVLTILYLVSSSETNNTVKQ